MFAITVQDARLSTLLSRSPKTRGLLVFSMRAKYLHHCREEPGACKARRAWLQAAKKLVSHCTALPEPTQFAPQGAAAGEPSRSLPPRCCFVCWSPTVFNWVVMRHLSCTLILL